MNKRINDMLLVVRPNDVDVRLCTEQFLLSLARERRRGMKAAVLNNQRVKLKIIKKKERAVLAACRLEAANWRMPSHHIDVFLGTLTWNQKVLETSVQNGLVADSFSTFVHCNDSCNGLKQ